MSRIYLPILLAGFVAISSVSAQSELWEKACVLADTGSIYLPGKITSITEELNGDGTRKSVIETVMSITYDSSGEVQTTELTQAFRDGKDITNELRKSRKDSKDRSSATAGSRFGVSGFNGMLFDAESRKKIRLLPGASWIERNGRKIGLVPFDMDMGPMGKMTGSAEIDAQTGVPLVVRMTGGNVPFVRNLSFTMTYEALISGGFVLSRMEIAGSVSVLFTKKAFRDSTVPGDYRVFGTRQGTGEIHGGRAYVGGPAD
jgi:hypothetical protein